MSKILAYTPSPSINSPNEYASHLAGFASGGDLFTVRTAPDPHLLVVENTTAAGRGEREHIAITATDLPLLISALLRVQEYMADCEREL